MQDQDPLRGTGFAIAFVLSAIFLSGFYRFHPERKTMTQANRVTKLEATVRGQLAPNIDRPRLGDTAILHGPVHAISYDGQYANISLPSLGEIRVLVLVAVI